MMIEQTRYRTREGMKTFVKKGRAAGGIAYENRTKPVYDAKGNRIPANGRSTKNKPRSSDGFSSDTRLEDRRTNWLSNSTAACPLCPARGLKWRDTAIRRHRDRSASGVPASSTTRPIGRLAFNRRNFRNNPEWRTAKRAHRPQYLLSDLLECDHCCCGLCQHGPGPLRLLDAPPVMIVRAPADIASSTEYRAGPGQKNAFSPHPAHWIDSFADHTPETPKASLEGGFVVMVWLRGPDCTETCKFHGNADSDRADPTASQKKW